MRIVGETIRNREVNDDSIVIFAESNVPVSYKWSEVKIIFEDESLLNKTKSDLCTFGVAYVFINADDSTNYIHEGVNTLRLVE